MELIAENSFTVTEELYIEGSIRLQKDEHGRSTRNFLIVLTVIWAAITVYMIAQGWSFIAPVVDFVVLVLVTLWLLVLYPRRRAKKGWKAMKEKYNGDLKRTTRFYEDRLESDAGESTLIVNYEDIRRTLETEHMLIFINSDKRGVMAAKDGFTRGDVQAVQEKIKEWSL